MPLAAAAVAGLLFAAGLMAIVVGLRGTDETAVRRRRDWGRLARRGGAAAGVASAAGLGWLATGWPVVAAVVVAAVAGSLRSPGSPTGAQVAAIVASGLACTATVVAGGLRMSVRRPHRADLRGPRDAVAPPGALALASARLALPTAVVGSALEAILVCSTHRSGRCMIT